jgi:FAD-dependent urate hydroxylase
MRADQVVIVGAGPHGLAAAAHLRRAGMQPRVFGDPMSFWHRMPLGMLLRSNWPATCIAEH